MFSPANLRLSIVTAVLWSAGILPGSSLTSQQVKSKSPAAEESQSLGKLTYSSACASCHGLDARGTERAPNIATSTNIRTRTDAQIASIISNGIPDTGMPGFHTLSPVQIQSIVGYLRSQQGEGDGRSVSGDWKHGKAIFFGKGECSNCHMVQGQGGFAGPDLTYDPSMSAKTIREGIVSANRVVRRGYKRVVLTMRNGKRLQGLLRNEDNFSVQLQDEDGQYHFFQKSDLKSFEYVKEPLMPTDYGTRLTASEIDDLVSFLMHSAGSAGKTNPVKRSEYDE
jgi:putative heme-binding domain-containing protein